MHAFRLFLGLVTLALAACGGIWYMLGETSDLFASRFACLLDVRVTVDNNATSFLARPAAFGPLPPLQGSEPSLTGNLTFLAIDACSEVAQDLRDHIAVVLRGGCRFYTKVYNLQSAGAMAVIVANNEDSGLLNMFMSGPVDQVEISSVFVSRQTYLELQNYHEATIETCPQDMTMVSSVILFVLSPLLSLTIVYVFLIVQRYHERLRMRAPRYVVDALPVRIWSETNPGSWGNSECVICLDAYNKNSSVVTLPCGHEYHEACIRRWLLSQKRTCPICNRPVTETEQV